MRNSKRRGRSEFYRNYFAKLSLHFAKASTCRLRNLCLMIVTRWLQSTSRRPPVSIVGPDLRAGCRAACRVEAG